MITWLLFSWRMWMDCRASWGVERGCFSSVQWWEDTTILILRYPGYIYNYSWDSMFGRRCGRHSSHWGSSSSKIVARYLVWDHKGADRIERDSNVLWERIVKVAKSKYVMHTKESATRRIGQSCRPFGDMNPSDLVQVRVWAIVSWKLPVCPNAIKSARKKRKMIYLGSQSSWWGEVQELLAHLIGSGTT